MAAVAELFATLGLVPKKGEWDKGKDLIKDLHNVIAAYLGVEAVKQLGKMVEATVEAAVQAKHLGEQFGLSGESVQELGYAADVTGGSAEGMRVAFQRLSRGLEDARTKGTGPAITAFERLGISLSSLQGKGLDQSLEVIADRFAKMPDGATKAALAIQLFGRQGAALIPLLDKGKAGIEDLRMEARRLGVVIDEEGIKKAEEFEIAQKRFAATLTGVRNTVVGAVLPALERMVNSLQKWIATNRQLITNTLKTALEYIAIGFHIVGTAIQEVTEFFIDHREIAISVLSAIGLALAVFAANAAISWALAIWPIALVIAAVAGLILLIRNWGTVWDWIKAKIHGVWEAIKASVRDILGTFGALVGSVIGFFERIGNGIKNIFKSAWQFVVDEARAAWDKIQSLPVIGRILKFGASAVNASATSYIRGGGGPGGAPSLTDLRGAGGTYALHGAGPTSATTTQSVSFGDTHIEVSGVGLDERQLSERIGQQIRTHHSDVVRQAFDNLKGGKR